MKSLDRKKRLPVWARTILALVLTIIGIGIWGFLAVAMGLPTVLVSIGSLVIGAVVLVQFFGEKNSPGSN